MKRIILLIVMLFSVAAMADAAPAAPGLIDFIKAHLTSLALLVYSLLDVLILAIPSLAGNGLIHQILLLAGKLAGMQPPAA